MIVAALSLIHNQLHYYQFLISNTYCYYQWQTRNSSDPRQGQPLDMYLTSEVKGDLQDKIY